MTFKAFSRSERFLDLTASVQYCSVCPRLCSRRKVLSTANGNIETNVVFVAEAPGRLGADRTGIPLHGDRTGDNFEALLGNIGWNRTAVFVTNAVLCNPRNEDGNNGTPTPEEIANCSCYLRMVLELIQPAVVVTLGATALKAVDMLVPHGRTLAEAVGAPVSWAGRTLFPLYHPGPRALVHRSLLRQRSDFIKLASFVDPVKGLRPVRVPRRVSSHALDAANPAPFQQAILALVQSAGPMTQFKLTKLLYLSDLRCLDRHGHSITGETYLREAAGPWPPRLNTDLNLLEGKEVQIFIRKGGRIVAAGPSPRFDVSLPGTDIEVLLDVVKQYGAASDAAIKTAAYLTAPMKYVLREERKGLKMTNKVVLQKDSTIIDTDSR